MASALDDPHVLRVFTGEVANQCSYALRAFGDLEEADSVPDTFAAIQAFLIATANISKLLWGSKQTPTRATERAPLRRALSVGDESPLKLRQWRNYFEHYDERIEKWARADPARNYVDQNVGSIDEIAGPSPHSFMRNYDPTLHRLWLSGECCDLMPMVAAVCQLRQRADRNVRG